MAINMGSNRLGHAAAAVFTLLLVATVSMFAQSGAAAVRPPEPVSGGGVSAQNPISGGPFLLVNHRSGKCLDVPGGQTANGTRLQQWSCNFGATQQKFRFVPTGTNPGFFQIRLWGNSNKCVDAVESTGASVKVWDCNGGANQEWYWYNSNTFSMLAHGLYFSMDVTGASTADGAPIQMWMQNDASQQLWSAYAA